MCTRVVLTLKRLELKCALTFLTLRIFNNNQKIIIYCFVCFGKNQRGREE